MTQTVVITRLWDETEEVRCFELRPATGAALAAAEPGAHIDVHVSNALIRQYSLLNGPGDRDAYFIGVKREPHSRGGSAGMHKLAVGDHLTIGTPRNNFRLHDGEQPALLLAGGIGMTPLMSMARHLEARATPFALHLFGRTPDLSPFATEIGNHARMHLHCGLVTPGLDQVLTDLLRDGSSGDGNLYVCGPAPFMELVTRLALAGGWPAERVHQEYFTAAPVDTSGNQRFEVEARQSGILVQVRPDQSVAQALIDAGVDLLTSCEQGVCGTCATAVIEGEPDHRDSYLNAAERASCKIMTPCVSRCKGARLVLDV